MAPHAALAEIGVEYELVRIERDDAQADAGYRALNPLGVVPTLVDGDLVLTESAAILLYLADRYPRGAPGAGRPRAVLPLARLHDERAPDRVPPHVLSRALRRRRRGPPGRGGGGARALRRSSSGALDGRDWLVGEHRTAADLFLFMLTRWGRRLDPPAWDRPAIRAHFLRTLALPGVGRMIEEQQLELPDWATPT